MRGSFFCVSAKIVIPLLFLVAASCSNRGPKTGEVRGTVTFEGKPVTSGRITFLNQSGAGDFEAEVNADGTYAIKNPVVEGDYLVTITPLIHIVDTDPGKSPPAPVEKEAHNIPMKYRQQGTTTLKAKVNEGKNTVELAMKKGT